jgi:hypothetical protein
VINLWEKGQGLSSEELIVTTPAHGEEDMYLYMEQSGAGSSTPCKVSCNYRCHVKSTGRTP